MTPKTKMRNQPRSLHLSTHCLGVLSLVGTSLFFGIAAHAAAPQADAFSVPTPPAIAPGLLERLAKLEASVAAQAAAAPDLRLVPPPSVAGGPPTPAELEWESSNDRVIGEVNGKQIVERDGEILAIPLPPLLPGQTARSKRKPAASVAPAASVVLPAATTGLVSASAVAAPIKTTGFKPSARPAFVVAPGPQVKSVEPPTGWGASATTPKPTQ